MIHTDDLFAEIALHKTSLEALAQLINSEDDVEELNRLKEQQSVTSHLILVLERRLYAAQPSIEPVIDKEVELDDFAYHEVLDRTNLCLNMVEDFLVQHTVTDTNPFLKLHFDAVTSILADAYQLVGQLDFNRNCEISNPQKKGN